MIEIILATIGLSFLLAYISFKLDNKHQVMKAITLFFAIYGIFLLGKLAIDSKNICDNVIATENIIGNTTSYTYTTNCFNVTTTNTPNTIYKTGLWFTRLTFLYVFGFVIWLVAEYLKGVIRK